MANVTPPQRPHPLILLAAVSVTAFSAVGIGVLTGAIHGNTEAAAPVAVSTPAAPAQVAALAPAATVAATPTPVTNVTVNTSTAPVSLATGKPITAATPEAAKPVVAEVRKPKHHHVEHKPVINQPSDSMAAASSPPPVPDICYTCGTVVSVDRVVDAPAASGVGAVTGAILGGVLGHQLGKGHGREAMTAAGVLGGAFAGNQIEKSGNEKAHYEVSVQMQDGSSRRVNYDSAPNISPGEKVRVNGDVLVRDN